MEHDFFQFIQEPSREAFLKSRDFVINHEEYDPYSDDLDTIEALLDEGKFEEAVDYHNINVLLCPKAHLYKSFALKKLGREDDARSESIFAFRIIDNLELTGDGSLASPYVVTRISDESDFLMHLEEGFGHQSLVNDNGKFLDKITTQSGKEIHFDITDCYKRMQYLIDSGKMKLPFSGGQPVEAKQVKKSWWKFW